jgi:hypothetical protein
MRLTSWHRPRAVDDRAPDCESTPVDHGRICLNVVVVGDEQARAGLRASAETRSDRHSWVVGDGPADVVVLVATGDFDVDPVDRCPTLLWARDVVGPRTFVHRAFDRGIDAVVVDTDPDVVIAQLDAFVRRPPASASTRLLEVSALMRGDPASA